eukprot:Skav215975  [mRNA]  locus=scaffold1158:60855:68030:- [translate_table: standard]
MASYSAAASSVPFPLEGGDVTDTDAMSQTGTDEWSMVQATNQLLVEEDEKADFLWLQEPSTELRADLRARMADLQHTVDRLQEGIEVPVPDDDVDLIQETLELAEGMADATGATTLAEPDLPGAPGPDAVMEPADPPTEDSDVEARPHFNLEESPGPAVSPPPGLTELPESPQVPLALTVNGASGPEGGASIAEVEDARAEFQYPPITVANVTSEVEVDMVIGPLTALEAAQHCGCQPEDLCPGPLAAIDEGDKVPLARCWPTDQDQWVILKADVTKAHRRVKVLAQDCSFQVAQLDNEWWVNKVGTYGMASAQLYWGRLAALLLRLVYHLFRQVDWGFIFVDDFCWLLKQSTSGHMATAILATLIALGTPLSWKKTHLAETNTWLCFVVHPNIPQVQMAAPKHVIVMELLSQLIEDKVFTAKEIEKALGRIQWATAVCPLTKSLMQPSWAWKMAVTSSGQAFIGGWLSSQPNPDKDAVFWFHMEITPPDCPCAFKEGGPKTRIAALELFATLILCHSIFEHQGQTSSHVRLPVGSGNQGNVFALLNMASKKPHTAILLMELILTLHTSGSSLAPSHVPRELNLWADEFTHSDYAGFNSSLRIDVKAYLAKLLLVPRLRPDGQVDFTDSSTQSPGTGFGSLG